MVRRPRKTTVSADQKVAMSTDALLMAALERGGDTSKTGRFLITYKEGAAAAGMKALQARRGLRVASAKDFASQAMDIQQAGDADAVMFPEIGVALVSSEAVAEHGLTTAAFAEEDAHAQSVDPEYFMFASQINPADYLKGVLRTAEMIAEDLGGVVPTMPADVSAQVAGVTWGLSACKVPYSQFSGKGIKVAVLDTGFDLGHPEFAGRSFVTNTFVGDPVQDVHGHGTHTVGTACGPLAPAGPIQRYGIGYGAQIFVGKVLSNSGSGTQAQVLAGMNWAIANKCAVISMSLGAQIPVQPSYTAAGAAALAAGCLIIAAAGNASSRPRSHQSGGRTGEFADRHVGCGARQFTAGGGVLQRRENRHCGTWGERLLVLAPPDFAQHDQRHQHGDPPCLRMRRAMGSEQPRPARGSAPC